MAWLALIVAGVLEVVWAYAMKLSHGFTRAVPTVVAIVALVASLGLLAYAMRALPLGTAYAVWTGIGALGAFAVGIIVLGEPLTFLRVLAVSLMAAGLVMLRLTSATE